MYVILFVLGILVLATFIILRLPVFGGVPTGDRLARIKRLPLYKDGALVNLSPTPMKREDVSYWEIILGMLEKNVNRTPSKPLPHIKPDFNHTSGTKVIWFGHSSYLVQTSGMTILVDPVFSSRTSPFAFLGTKNYAGTDFIRLEDIPDPDVVLITHDHYDHLDYPSIQKLKQRTKLFVTSLGVGAHLERWGIESARISELAWGERREAAGGLMFTAVSARHFTGRGFRRNQTLWSAFVLQTPTHKLYLGGDSGYDIHFKEAGAKHGPFDLAILECGQYNAYWPAIHMFPEQTVQAAVDLHAKMLLPVHWGKFTLGMHDWSEPVKRAVKRAKDINFNITTPMLGESIVLDESYPDKQWWENY